MKPEREHHLAGTRPYLLLVLSEGLFRDLALLLDNFQLLSQRLLRTGPCGLSFRHLHREKHQFGSTLLVFSAPVLVLLRQLLCFFRSPDKTCCGDCCESRDGGDQEGRRLVRFTGV